MAKHVASFDHKQFLATSKTGKNRKCKIHSISAFFFERGLRFFLEWNKFKLWRRRYCIRNGSGFESCLPYPNTRYWIQSWHGSTGGDCHGRCSLAAMAATIDAWSWCLNGRWFRGNKCRSGCRNMELKIINKVIIMLLWIIRIKFGIFKLYFKIVFIQSDVCSIIRVI